MIYFENLQLTICCILFFIIGTVNGNSVNSHKDKSKTLTPVFYGESTSLLSNLSSSLFTNYDPTVRPYCQGQEKINLSIDMAIRQLIELDEPNQVVRLNIWMRLKWKDCQLAWDPMDYDGVKDLTVPYTSVWVPDITLYERISDEFYGLDDFRPTIYYDGTIKYNFPSTIEALCPIDVTRFPFDTQICSLMFGSWAYHGFDLNVTSNSMAADLSTVKSNVEWIVEKAPATRHEGYYNGIPEPYPDITFKIYLKRKPMYYVSNIIIPAVLITCIAALGFILPADSGEKIGLELTVMLAMWVFQLLVADKLPPSSDSTPWIGVYFTFTLVLSGVASLIQVLVLNLHHRGDQRVPEWLAFNVLQPLATLTLTDVPGFKPFKCITKQNGDAIKKEDLLPEDPVLWRLLATCVDRLGLMLFLMTFSIGTAVIFTNMLDHVYL